MIAQTRAELLKIRSTRTTIGLMLGMVALILLFTVLTGLLTHADALMTRDNQRQLFSLSNLAGVFAALAGVLLVTSEYRYGTIRPTILFNPGRSEVIAAKLVAGALAGAAFGVLAEAIGWGVGYTILAGRGITVVLDSGDVLLLVLGGLGGVALWGAIGAGLGAIIRNQVGAVVTLLAWGVRRRQSPVRSRSLRRAVHAHARARRAGRPPGATRARAMRRWCHLDRLDCRARRHWPRSHRPARHRLTPTGHPGWIRLPRRPCLTVRRR